MFRYVWTVVLLIAFVIPRPVCSEPDRSTVPESFDLLKRIVNTSESTSSYQLDVHFKIDASDREDTITIQSRGWFRSPHYRLMSETPAGMEVESFGWKSNVRHIHPSTDEIVTSDELGVSSVNRTLLDPFEHMAYILDPSKPPAAVKEKGTEEIDGETYQILRVEVGTGQVREVMNEFRNQLNRPLKPQKTKAVYRLLYDQTTDRIRRIHLSVQSEFVSKDSGENPDFENDPTLPPVDDGTSNKPVTVDVKGTFDLTRYESVPDLQIPTDVKRRLKGNGENP